MALIETLSYVAISSATAVIYRAIRETIKRVRRNKDIEDHIDERIAESVLNSSDIDTIGRYIFEELGSVRIRDFSLSKETESRLDLAIEQIEEYFGDPESESECEAPFQSNLETEPEPEDANLDYTEMVPAGLKDSLEPEMQVVYDQLVLGESWNTLARLRLKLETIVRETATKFNVVEDPFEKSALKLILAMTALGIIDQNTRGKLISSLMTSNTAIHGGNVTDTQTIQAVIRANSAIKDLKKLEKK